MSETKQDLEDEVTRLRKRVTELEGDLENERKKPKKHSKTSQAKNISSRAVDEGSGLIRGVAVAGIESVRLAGGVMSSFADTVSQRNRPEEKDSTSDLTRDLPKDVYSGALNAVEQALDIPGKVIDKLQEGYNETRET